MVGFTVVKGQFFTGLYISQRIELSPAIGDAHVNIGGAGMIDVGKRAAVHATIDGHLAGNFYNRYAALRFSTSSAFANRDAFARIFTNFGAGTNGRIGEYSGSVNRAFTREQHR